LSINLLLFDNVCIDLIIDPKLTVLTSTAFKYIYLGPIIKPIQKEKVRNYTI